MAASMPKKQPESSISPLTWISLLAIVASLAWLGWNMTQKPQAAPAAHQSAPERQQEAPAKPAAKQAPPSGGERMNG